MFDPAAADEIVVSDDAAAAEGLHVGDVVPFVAMLDGQSFSEPARGPALDEKVVGIVHTPLSNVFTGGAFLSPGFISAYGGQAYVPENAVVQLRHGASDVVELRRHVNTDLASGTPVLDFRVTGRRVTATTDVERAMLLLLALIVAAAGVVFVGQALSRSAGTIGVDRPALSALGMSRRQLVDAAVRPHLVSAAVAFVVTAVTAGVASRWFPVGLAARVAPHRGVQVAAALIASASLLTAAFVVGGAALFGWLVVRAEPFGRRERPTIAARLGLLRPLPVGIGARMALDGGGPGGRAATRPALIGAAAAVAGIVAILSVNHGLNDSLAHPDVAGVAWDATVTPLPTDISASGTGTPSALDTVIESVRSQPGVASVATVLRGLVEFGEVGVPTFAVVDDVAGERPVRLVTLSGRRPQRVGEVELGPSTAHDLGVGVGDTITAPGAHELRVVGLGLFPSDVHAQFDEGAWVLPSDWVELAPATTDAEFVDLTLAVNFADRRDVGAQTAALGAALGSAVAGVAAAERPEELANLHNVRALPTVLAVFLTVLAVLAVGHSLLTSVRRRRKEFAVLHALGITRGGARVILAAHGSAVALAGLAVGIPGGLVAGRFGWRAITDRVPLVFRSPLTAGALVLVVPAAIIAANALAIMPGRRAARLQPAAILRSE
jgi:ABC-type lipoprotein release transport system permease subunit